MTVAAATSDPTATIRLVRRIPTPRRDTRRFPDRVNEPASQPRQAVRSASMRSLPAGAFWVAVLALGCGPTTEESLVDFPEEGSDCQPVVEVCDGLDNDCDGDTDEIGDLAESGSVGVPCGTSEGPCDTGVAACRDGVLVCEGEEGPSPETCDGTDEDCDGEIDERADLAAAGVAGVACGEDEGQCEAGIQECRQGGLVCEGGTPPGTETCDGTDEDCDGQTDEEVVGFCEACAPPDGLGACRHGVRLCIAGEEVCAPHPSRAAAVDCDLLDNDCDGVFDEAGEEAPAAEGLRG